MPITKSAKKTLRQDKRRSIENQRIADAVKKAVRIARKTPTKKVVQAAFSTLDRAAKKHVIHRNKADRLKSRLSRALSVRETKSSQERKSNSNSASV